MEDFARQTIETEETTIAVRTRGKGPPLLLLHGFPQTSLMWRDVAPALARDFTIVCADLRGYGESGCPSSSADHAEYSKRAMARDIVCVMDRLGFARFCVAGHDRGGRVAYRLALDHPGRVERLALLDILPTDATWRLADERFALGYWPWTLLAQPAPLPERMLAAAPDAIVDAALGGWGSPAETVPDAVRAAYIKALRDQAHIHAICEEYRAAATVDREHDRADGAAGTRIKCPTLILWSAGGPLDSWYANEGGPLGVWREWCEKLEGHALDGGHFFPEANPAETVARLSKFFLASD